MTVPNVAVPELLSTLGGPEADAFRTLLARLEHDVAAATQRAELAEAVALRLREVQEAVRRFSRTLGEQDVAAELGGQVARMVGAEIVAVLDVDLDSGQVTTRWRSVRGQVLPRGASPLAAGLVADAARTGRSRAAAHAAPSALAQDDLDHAVLEQTSALAVPMLAAQKLEGVLLAVWLGKEPPPWAQDVLEALASHAGAAMRNARLYADSERERRQSEALAAAAAAVGESLRLGEVQRLILRHAMALLRSHGAWLGLLEDRYVHVVAGVGTSAVLTGRLIPRDGTAEGRVVLDRVPVTVADAEAADLFRPTQRAANIRRAVMVPLLTARGVIGVLTANDREAPFTDDDVRTLQRLADQCAVAVFNARLFEEARAATLEWKVVFDAVPSGVVVLDEQGHIARFNARALALTDGTAQTLMGRAFGAVLLGTDADAAPPAPVAEALATGAVTRGLVAATARGRLFDLLVSPHPDGGVVATFDDVTDVRALEQRHRSVVETASDAIMVTSPSRRVTFANPAALELFGDDALVGRPVEELVVPEQRAAVYRAETAAFEGHEQRYETLVRRRDGDLRTVSVHTAPLLEPGGRVGELVASLRDITEERRARDAIAKSEARYRNLFEHATDAIYTLDRRGHFTSANAAAGALAAVPTAALLGQSVTPFIADDEARDVADRFRRAMAGEAVRFETSMRRADGSTRLLSVVNTPIREDGQVRGVLGIARDITDERTREQALLRSEARYSRLVEAAGDAIFTLDEAGTLTSVNRVLERTMGLPREAMLGQPFTVLLERSPDRDALWRVLRDTLKGEVRRAEFQYRDARGELRGGSLLATPIEGDGRVVGVLSIVRDVTDERRLQEQLQLQERLAAIGELVSGVAHELNNPLAGVIAHAQLLLAVPGLDADVQDAAGVIHGEAKRAARIVGNLLTFARQSRPQRVVADLAVVVRDTVALRRYQQRLIGIQCDLEVPASLPATFADEGQLQQVVLNLIVNAEHALENHAGPRRLRVEARAEGDALVISVSDTGPGISPDVLPRIFHPFFTTKPVGKGTGLGLSLVDGIVKEHGGRIEVDSSPEHGTTFRIVLPRLDPPALGGANAEGRAPFRVLVADPDAEARRLAARALAEAGDAVLTLADPDDVVRAALAREWDVILLDAGLHGGATALVHRLREVAPAAAARVALTGDASDQAARPAATADRPWLDKPYDLASLPGRLRGVLG